MFSLFKSNPVKKLHKTYAIKLEEAMRAQRNGDIEGYAMISAEADELWQRIQRLESQRNN